MINRIVCHLLALPLYVVLACGIVQTVADIIAALGY